MKRELYEYPSRISTVAEAERAQKLRMQASEADHDRVSGRSTSRVIEGGDETADVATTPRSPIRQREHRAGRRNAAELVVAERQQRA